jgi:hypothetical protein
VLVTVVPASTEYEVAVPKLTGVAANAGDCCEIMAKARRKAPVAPPIVATFRWRNKPMVLLLELLCMALCCIAVSFPHGANAPKSTAQHIVACLPRTIRRY